MRSLVSYLFKQSPGIVVIAMIMGIVAGLCNTGALVVLQQAIPYQGDAPQVLLFSFLGLCILLPVFRVISQILLAKLMHQLAYNLRMRIARQVMVVPLRKVEQIGPSTLTSVVATDVGMISQSLSFMPAVCMDIAIVASCFGYLFYLFPLGAGLTLVMLVISLAIYMVLGDTAQKYFVSAREEQDSFYRHFNDLTFGAKELKLNRDRREVFVSEVMHGTTSSYRRKNILGFTFFGLGASLAQLLVFLMIGAQLFVMPKFWPEMTVEMLTAFTLVLVYIVGPLDGLTQMVPAFSNAAVSLAKVNRLGLSMEEASVERDGDVPEFNPDWQKLEYQGVTHAYYREKEGQVFTLGPIDLTFRPGELVFVIGGNGSGKTTLAKIILGLYQPEEGRILMDGREITDENRDAFRQFFSAVFTDFHLFEDLMGLCPPEKVALAQQYLERLQLNHKVEIEDGRLTTLDLSQGQRKRLALLTAFLEDRPIQVFDEWAADQDPTYKKFFYDDILPSLKEQGKTAIVITHDDKYFDRADRIVKLDFGQKVEATPTTVVEK